MEIRSQLLCRFANIYQYPNQSWLAILCQKGIRFIVCQISNIEPACDSLLTARSTFSIFTNTQSRADCVFVAKQVFDLSYTQYPFPSLLRSRRQLLVRFAYIHQYPNPSWLVFHCHLICNTGDIQNGAS